MSIGYVWEWWSKWNDHSDLPKLQSVHLDQCALNGDNRDGRKTTSDEPYNYKNTLTMRSEIEWNDEWIDLPSLTTFKGDGANFYLNGHVILESIALIIDWTRYSSTIIQWNPFRFWLLHLHLFPPILKYSFSHLIIIRCYCSRISHQRLQLVSLIPFPLFHWIHIDNHESLNTQFTNLIESFITINNLISLFTSITQPIHDSDNQIHSLSINTHHRSI